MGCGVQYSKAEESQFFSTRISYQPNEGEGLKIDSSLNDLIFDSLNFDKIQSKMLEQQLFKASFLYEKYLNYTLKEFMIYKFIQDKEFNPKNITQASFKKAIESIFYDQWNFKLTYSNDIFNNLLEEKEETLDSERFRSFIIRANGKFSELILEELTHKRKLFGYLFVPTKRKYTSILQDLQDCLKEVSETQYRDSMIKAMKEKLDSFYIPKEKEYEDKLAKKKDKENRNTNKDNQNGEEGSEEDEEEEESIILEKPKRLITYDILAEFINEYEEKFKIVEHLLGGIYHYLHTLKIISEMILREIISKKSITPESLSDYFIETEKKFLEHFIKLE